MCSVEFVDGRTVDPVSLILPFSRYDHCLPCFSAILTAAASSRRRTECQLRRWIASSWTHEFVTDVENRLVGCQMHWSHGIYTTRHVTSTALSRVGSWQVYANFPKNSPDLQESHRFSRSWLTCSLEVWKLEPRTLSIHLLPSAAPILINPSRLLIKTKNDWRCLEQHRLKLLQTARQYAGLETVSICCTAKNTLKSSTAYRKNTRYCCGQRKQYRSIMPMLGWSLSREFF